MALPQSLNFLRVGTGSQALEVYLDPQCPFSAKITESINTNVLPLITKGGKYENKLHLIVRLYPQPFHYSSHLQVEALIAFGQNHPNEFWSFLRAIYAKKEEFYNVPAQELSPSQIRDKLIELALDTLDKEGKLPKGPRSQVYATLREQLVVKQGKDGSTNGGNDATLGLKHLVKIGRQNGIHVTPTVLFDGLKEDSVSSSWGKEEWEKFLAEKLSS